MKKGNVFFKVGLVVLMVGLLVTMAACSKKKSAVDPMETYPSESQMGEEDTQQAEAARALAEEELKAQRIKEAEAARMAAQEAARIQEEARMQFVNEDVYFNFDDASLSADARMALKNKVAWLRENPNASVLVEGHCDERGTLEYNIALGQRRAESVKTFMVNAGISASRINTISYGEERPVDVAGNEAAWAKNRRAHFKILN